MQGDSTETFTFRKDYLFKKEQFNKKNWIKANSLKDNLLK